METFAWALVGLRHATEIRKSHLIATAIRKLAANFVFSFAPRSTMTLVTFTIPVQSTNHARAFRVDQVDCISGREVPRRPERYLELASLLIKVPHGLLLVRGLRHVVRAVVRFYLRVVFVLKHFVFNPYAVLA